MIDFLKHWRLYFVFSAIMITIGLFGAWFFGFEYSIDFVGGGLIEYTSQKDVKPAERFFSQQEDYTFQKTNQGFIIKGTTLNKKKAETLNKKVNEQFQAKKKRFELVGPSVTQDNILKIINAALLSVLVILLYIAFSFKSWRFGVAAVVALLHDTLILVGAWSVLGHFFGAEVDVLFVTSVLTIMSFSVHDTIVIFDKIKEESQQGTYQDLKDIINWSLNLTMMRSINNSLTIVIMLSALIILGGESIRWFAVALLIGTLLGTYSSPFIASPVYYLLTKKAK